MGVRPAVAVVAVALAACGNDDVSAPAPAAPESRVETSDYVATPTLAQHSSQPLFAIPGLGRFRATCTGSAQAEVSYKAARATATQLVTTQSGVSTNGRLDPGQRIAVAIGRVSGPRVEWQVTLVSAGRIKVATASFAVGPLAGSKGCLVSGKAEVAERRR